MTKATLYNNQQPPDIYRAVFFWPLAFRGFLLTACFACLLSGRRLIVS
nr:MAG TPA: hypothetical protein [Caudoviricetes sp.]